MEEKIEEQQKSESDDEIFEEEFEPTPDPIKNNEIDVVTNIDEITNTTLECVDASNLGHGEPTNNDVTKKCDVYWIWPILLPGIPKEATKIFV